MTPIPPKADLTGFVKRQLVAAGSKSEHEALVLDAGNGRSFELRLKGGNPFREPALESFLNMHVRIEAASLMGSIAMIDKLSDITVLGPPGRPARPPQPKF